MDNNPIISIPQRDDKPNDGELMIEVTAFQFYLFMAALISLLTITILYCYYTKYKYIMAQRERYSQFSKLQAISSDEDDVTIIPLKH